MPGQLHGVGEPKRAMMRIGLGFLHGHGLTGRAVEGIEVREIPFRPVHVGEDGLACEEHVEEAPSFLGLEPNLRGSARMWRRLLARGE